MNTGVTVSITVNGAVNDTAIQKVLRILSSGNVPGVPQPKPNNAEVEDAGETEGAPTTTTTPTAKEPAKRHRRTKAEMEAAAKKVVKEPIKKDEYEGGEDEYEGGKEETGEEVENDIDDMLDIDGLDAEEEKAEPEYVLEDIITAFRDFARKHDRSHAGKVLTAFGVRSVRDLPKAKYAEIMKTLKG